MKLISIIIAILLAVAIAEFYILFSDFLAVQKQMLKIEEETHIDRLYSVYQSNISSCRTQVRQAGGDDGAVRENCLVPINESLIANWLRERGHGDLLEQ